jgi:hypothetical protein
MRHNGTPLGLLKLYPKQSNLQLEDIKIPAALAGSSEGFLSLIIYVRTPGIGFTLFAEESILQEPLAASESHKC